MLLFWDARFFTGNQILLFPLQAKNSLLILVGMGLCHGTLFLLRINIKVKTKIKKIHSSWKKFGYVRPSRI
jgi:hypothetical protein